MFYLDLFRPLDRHRVEYALTRSVTCSAGVT